MNRVDRLFGIVTLLQSRKYVTAEHISKQFDISIRTVYRDIKAVGEAGIPVSFEPNKGYFIVSGYFTPPVAFSLEEANALLLSQSLVNGFGDKSIQTYFDQALTKIRAVLKQVDKEKMEQLDQRIKLQLPKRLVPEFDYITVIQEAILEQKQLHLAYKNIAEEVSERMIEPIGLIFYAFSWHVIAFCHLRKEYRDFKIDRIQQLTESQKAFEIKQHMQLNDYQLPVNY
ncbi:MAG: YafY family transcriptional regulator [Fluviicola sp.]|nr:YafY family transcriptional regulator [Fluviicola sp.]